jgi:hypothetical protein
MPGHGTVARLLWPAVVGELPAIRLATNGAWGDVIVLALVLNEELDRLIQSSSVSGMRPSKPSISEASRNVSLFRLRQTTRLRDADELAR